MFSKLGMFIPVKKNMYVFESVPVYGDNTFPIYQYLVENKYQMRKSVWIVHNDHDYEIVRSKGDIALKDYGTSKISKICNLIKVNYNLARTEYYFFSHINSSKIIPSKKQKFTNLTHGVPIKDSSNRHYPLIFQNGIVTTSSFAGKLRTYTYGGGEEQLEILGYPRNDYIFPKKIVTNKINNNITNKKFGVWLPTYRTHSSELVKDGHDYFPLQMNSEQWVELDKHLEVLDYQIYLKPHPAQKLEISDNNLANIKFVSDDWLFENDLTLYQFLSSSSFLITDYSSVYLDYLLIDKPMIFTFDDIEEYISSWGFTVDDIRNYAPGSHVYTYLEFLNALDSVVKDDSKDFRNETKKLFHAYVDDQSSRRVVEKIVGKI